MNRVKDIGCAITAGGKATRMNGIIKAFVEVDGQRIIDRNLKVLESIFSQIQIITNQPQKFAEYSKYNISSDYYKNIGPLAGIHSAMKNNSTTAIFIIASDLPYLSAEIINSMITTFRNNSYDAIIPKTEGKIEPLFAIYRNTIRNNLESFIEKKESFAIRDFLQTINTHYLEMENTEKNRKSFHNVNRFDDFLKH